jgi:hypothetical protein
LTERVQRIEDALCLNEGPESLPKRVQRIEQYVFTWKMLLNLGKLLLGFVVANTALLVWIATGGLKPSPLP